MTKETLLEYINEVDEDLIENVPMENVTKKHKMARYIAVAAGIVAAVGAGMAMAKVNIGETQVVENTTGNTESSMTTVWSVDNTMFAYNNSNYRIVSDKEYLASNSLPISVQEDQVGACLENNIGDLANNVVLGDLYEYEDNDSSVLIVKTKDGSYEVAIKEDEQDTGSVEPDE